MIVVLGVILLMPSSASAHARLVSTKPSTGATLTAVPSAIVLTFDDEVNVEEGAIQVFSPDGSRVDSGAIQRMLGHRRVVQPIRVPKRVDGEWAVGWRTTSIDGHTERGTMVFSVGDAPTGDSAASRRATEAGRSPRALMIAAGIFRAITYVAMLAAVGGVVFGSVIVPGRSPSLLKIMLALLAASLAGSYIVDAAITHGTSLRDALSISILVSEAGNPYGRGALLTAALTVLGVVCLPLVRSPTGRAPSFAVRSAGVTVFAALVASLSLTGHSAASADAVWRMPMDVVHVIAAAVWFGGLIQLWTFRLDAEQYVRGIVRFSRVAAVCVAVLIATGIAALINELGMTLSAFQDSQYGHLLLAKLLLFAGTIPMAALNMTTLVPRITTHPTLAAPILRRYVVREGVLLLIVLAMTAWLVSTSPSA